MRLPSASAKAFAALTSPFARAALPQSHRLRLSWNAVVRVTPLDHRFDTIDYTLHFPFCQPVRGTLSPGPSSQEIYLLRISFAAPLARRGDAGACAAVVAACLPGDFGLWRLVLAKDTAPVGWRQWPTGASGLKYASPEKNVRNLRRLHGGTDSVA